MTCPLLQQQQHHQQQHHSSSTNHDGPSRCSDRHDCCKYQPQQHHGTDAELSNGRIASSIPRTDSPHNWLYPSPQQFHAAIARKGHRLESKSPSCSDADAILALHNVVNEQCWVEILKWERLRSSDVSRTSLKSFRGRPDRLSPKAWIRSNLFGYVRPFDRHDWIVQRADGERIRYVIDFYAGKPVPGGSASIHLDVRPAVDSFGAFVDRVHRMFASQ